MTATSADAVPLRTRPSTFRLPITQLVVLASFGPYILGGVGLRSEHVVLYPLFCLALLLILAGRRTLLAAAPLPAVAGLLSANLLWIALVTLVAPHYEDGSLVAAQVENMVQPLALLVVVGTFARMDSIEAARAALLSGCRWLIALLVANTLVAMLSMFLDIAPFIELFLREEQGLGSVWMAALDVGRFTGIFDQPMENGLAYSLGLLAWGYLTRSGYGGTVISYVLLFMMLLGGSLGMSKVFLFGGVPLFLLYVFSLSAVVRLPLNWRLWGVGAAGVTALMIALANWRGRTYLDVLMSGSGRWDLLTLMSGGRFGGTGETHVMYLFGRVMRESPVFGFGFGAEHMFDSTYAEFLISGGLVSLLLLLAVFGRLGLTGARAVVARMEEGRLLLAIVALLVGAGIGAPTVTINRFSTVLWLLVVLVVGVLHTRRTTYAGSLPDPATASPRTGPRGRGEA